MNFYFYFIFMVFVWFEEEIKKSLFIIYLVYMLDFVSVKVFVDEIK